MSQPDGTVELTITDLARGGSGVARLGGSPDDPRGGLAVFVPFTAPGDRVRARIVERQKRFLRAELVEVLIPSPERVAPRCPVFGRCGGCQWQHLPYALQWRTKVAGVQQALKRVHSIERFARVELPPLEELPATEGFGYRNRVQLHGEGAELGYFGHGTRRLVPTDRCPIARPEIQTAWEETRAEGAARATTPGVAPAYKVEVEVGADGQVSKSWNAPHAALGFRQVNDDQNLRLREWVVRSIAPGRQVYDLFGGSGNLSQLLAARALSVDCVDTGSPPVAPSGTPANLRFHRSAVLPWLKKQIPRARPIDGGTAAGAGSGSDPASAILDPPREGLADAAFAIIQHLERLDVREALLVGCDLDSWVRDLMSFAQQGWAFKKLAVLDLMPQTIHVESLALLTKD